MDFAEQERRPEQIVIPEYQSFPAEGSEEDSMFSGNGVDYSKVPKALQGSPIFGNLSAPPQESVQRQSNLETSVAKAGENSDSAPLGGTIAPPILIAGGLGSALPAPGPNPLQGAAEAFGKGAAAVGRGAAGLGLGELAIPLAGAIPLVLGPLAQPANNEEIDWMRRNAARQQVLQSTQDHGGGKNAQHGKSEDRPSDLKRLGELNEQIENATGREKKKLQTTVNNLKKAMAARRKGENHSQKDKR
jgi:hypothetical protein